ncbi:MAG: hypothetical protein U1D67_00680, partial [Dehalococcoidia bacterium]|nr:hypothetical protein [Dehalococcoidia bacterium]
MPSNQPITPAAPEVKTYQLSKEERADLLNRAAIKEQLSYQAHCVDMEMKAYVERFVKPRCGLKPEETPTMFIAEGKFTVPVKPGAVPTPPQPAAMPDLPAAAEK